MPKNRERTQSIKIVIIMLGVTLWSLTILVRLVQLQVVQHEKYENSARNKQQNTQSVSAPRGIIYSSQMDVLATNAPVKNVVVEPIKIDNKPEAARKLAAILNIDPQELLERMSNPAKKRYLRVKRRIDPAAEESIKNLGIKSLYFEKESMRVYPSNELASHVLGFANWNGNGAEGIELQYDKVLRGQDGLLSFDIDARGQSYGVNVEKPSVQGNSLVLSIDKSIQYTAARELEAAVKNAQAKAGTVIVMESDTGRILAIANYPNFNPNTYNNFTADERRNRAATDMFEPGSTFKVVVATAALEAGLTHPDDIIDCEEGSIVLGGHTFRDHKPYGFLPFKEVLEHSSNVGAIKLGLKLGQQGLYEGLLNFGFGSLTKVDLPGEIVGLIRKPKDWSGLSIGAISFGQEIGVTSLQMLTAINVIANGGYRVRPSVLDRIIDENGRTLKENRPELTQIVSPRTAETVTEAFEGVVLRGTGKNAALDGYRAAGKTGTAQKSVNGRYPKGVYISSFIGFAPLPHPKVTILVQLDEPRNGYYGSEVCAPYFRNIAQEVLLKLRVPPDTNVTVPEWSPSIVEENSQDFIPNAVPVKPLTVLDKQPPVEDSPDIIAIPIESEWTVMPDFQGLSKRGVLDRCIDLGIRLNSKGSGMAVFQSPPPGTEIPVGSTCTVTFATTNLKKHLASAESAPEVRKIPMQLSSNSPF